MADEEKIETTEEDTPEVEAVSDTETVSDTTVEETVPEVEAEAVAEEAAPEAEEVSDTAAAVSDTEPAVPAAPAKKQRSLKHVPRTLRRTRTKVVREKAKTRKPILRTTKPEQELGRRQERRGVVVSDKGDKTIIVKVDVIKSHPKYKKVVRSTVKFHAHDEANSAGVGDKVRIIETRPLSKLKRWRLAEIVEKAK